MTAVSRSNSKELIGKLPLAEAGDPSAIGIPSDNLGTIKMLSNSGTALLLLSALAIPLTLGQFVSSLPQCVQGCIDQSQDDNCSVADVACLCRASSGNFLPDLITCMHNTCDNDLDINLLLAPLQLICEVVGAPIPESAIWNAENQASSLASQVTTTVTVGGSSATGGAEATTTVSMPSSVSTKTITKTESGSTIYVLYPITVGRTTTVSGKPSTVTVDSVSTFTTTNSRGRTVTETETYTQTAGESGSGAAESSVSSTTTLTTSVQAVETSSSGSPSRTSTRNPEVTNSSPFTTTNGNDGSKERVGSLLGLSVFLFMCCFWY